MAKTELEKQIEDLKDPTTPVYLADLLREHETPEGDKVNLWMAALDSFKGADPEDA